MCHWGERILKGGLVGAPIKYRYVILCNDNYRKKVLVHRLIYETFIGEIIKGMEIDHIDSNPLNNRLDNLQILTASENNKKAGTGKNKIQYSYILTDVKTGEQHFYKTITEASIDLDVSIHHMRSTAFERGTTKLLKGRFKVKPIKLIK